MFASHGLLTKKNGLVVGQENGIFSNRTHSPKCMYPRFVQRNEQFNGKFEFTMFVRHCTECRISFKKNELLNRLDSRTEKEVHLISTSISSTHRQSKQSTSRRRWFFSFESNGCLSVWFQFNRFCWLKADECVEKTTKTIACSTIVYAIQYLF